MSSSAQTFLVPSLKDILFATDFSPCSQVAFPYLRALAERYGSTIHVVHVLTPEPTVELPLDSIPELAADRDVAQSAMKIMLASEPFGKAACTTTVKRGPLWQVLEEVIEEKKIDLIVLGTHGRRGLRKFVLGSVAEQVFRLAQCPVLTVGPHAMDEGIADANFATILFATDFSSGSRRALSYAVSLARANKSHVILLHAASANMEVVPAHFFDVGPATVEASTELIAEDLASKRQRLAELIAADTMEELKPEIIVDCGPAAETILSIAKTKRANLIVMGAHRASLDSFATRLPWATLSSVVCQAHCPVLSVRS
jgi:nucleotide-binding universal stress UspA family protein